MTNKEIDEIIKKVHPEYFDTKHLWPGTLTLIKINRLCLKSILEDPDLSKLVTLNANSDKTNATKWLNFFNEYYICEVIGQKDKKTHQWVKSNLKNIRAHISVYTEGEIVDPLGAIEDAVKHLKLQERLRQEHLTVKSDID